MSGKDQKPKFEPASKPSSEESTKTFTYAPKGAAKAQDEKAARDSSQPPGPPPPKRAERSSQPSSEERLALGPMDSVTTRIDTEDERLHFQPSPKKEAEPLESITAPMAKEKKGARSERISSAPLAPEPSIQTVTAVFEGAREPSRPAPHAHAPMPPPVEAPMPPASSRGLPPPPPSLRVSDPKQAQTLSAPSPGPREPASKKKEETTQPRFTMLTWTPVNRACYRIEGVFAQGGIGRILKAHDLRLNRTVAVKELLVPKGEAKERFAREVYLTARLQHPSIVPVYEAGTWHDGDPFYAMKLVSGRSMLDCIVEAKTLEQRLPLVPHVLAMAEAMAYAHAKKIIHRDLKPANVMIGEFGETIVIDWGLAKELDETGFEKPDGDNTIRHKLTNAGAVVGTPAYMPPEQAMGHPVDERADVYSIGAVLYHVLTGQPPYDGKSVGEVLKKLVTEAPVPLEKLVRGVPGELRAILEKAMARRREQRYPTARELAADLRRFSTGQMVSVQRHSPAAFLRRFLRRYSSALIATFVLLAVLGALGAFSVQRVIKARDSAAKSEADAQLRADQWMLAHVRSVVARDPNEALAWMKKLGSGSPLFGHVRTLLADARARGVATVLRGHTGPVVDFAFSPDGKFIVSASEDQSLRVWDVGTAETRALFKTGGDVGAAMYSADGLEILSHGKESGLRIWDARPGGADKNVEKQKYPGAIRLNWARMSADGKSIFALAPLEGLKIWDRATGKDRMILPIKGHDRGIALSPDGNTIGFCADGDALLWDLRTSARRSLPNQESLCTALLFSPDGKTLVVGAEDGFLRFFNTEDLKRIQKTEAHRGEVRRMVFLRDGRRLISAGVDAALRISEASSAESRLIGRAESVVLALVRAPNTDVFATAGGEGALKLWHPEAGVFKSLGGFNDTVSQIAFSPDGRSLAAASLDGTLRIWRMDQISDRIVSYLKTPLSHVRFLPDGRHAALGAESGRVWLVRLADGETKELGVHSGKLNALVLSADGKRIASAGEDGMVRVFDADFSQSRERLFKGHSGPVQTLIWAAGSKLISAGADKKLFLWDIPSEKGDSVAELSAPPRAITALSEGAEVALGDESGTVYLFVLQSKTLKVLGKHAESIGSLDFSPEKNRLISGAKDKALRLWNWPGGADRSIDTGGAEITKVLFGAKGDWIASMGAEPELRLWDSATGRSKAILAGHRGKIAAMAISPEGHRLVSANSDRSLQLWDIENQEQRVLLGHSGDVRDIGFGPDGKSFLSVSADGTLRIWMDDLPSDEASLRAALSEMSRDTISVDSFMNTIGIEPGPKSSKP